MSTNTNGMPSIQLPQCGAMASSRMWIEPLEQNHRRADANAAEEREQVGTVYHAQRVDRDLIPVDPEC
jgi:hypothetical protein